MPDSLKQHESLSALILSGGRARRMAGQDKGLINYQDRPLISYAIAMLEKAVDDIVISANRHIEQYRDFGYPVVEDFERSFYGPLAGILAGLSRVNNAKVCIIPCDMPFLPFEALNKLHKEVLDGDADIAVPIVNGKLQPVVQLMRVSLAESLKCYLDEGNRKVSDWLMMQRTVQVDFTEQADWFVNMNSKKDLLRDRLAYR